MGPLLLPGLATGNGTAAGRLWSSTLPAVPRSHPVLSKTHKPPLISSYSVGAGVYFLGNKKGWT